MQPESNYAVLGIHGNDVDTVQGNVARIRMFVGDQVIDEDFNLPRIITIEEQIDEAVKRRMDEIVTKGSDPSLSNVVPEQSEQIVKEAENV